MDSFMSRATARPRGSSDARIHVRVAVGAQLSDWALFILEIPMLSHDIARFEVPTSCAKAPTQKEFMWYYIVFLEEIYLIE